MNTQKQPINAALIVAAGRGRRAASEALAHDGPKQYHPLGKASVLAHALYPFIDHPDIDHILVVIHEDDVEIYQSLVPKSDKILPHTFGGATRQLSVYAGLDALASYGLDHVLIHDAARPFIDNVVISNVLEGLKTAPSALPCIAVADTLKRATAHNTIEQTVSRQNLFAAQTPQGFHYQTICQAHHEAGQRGESEHTDDCSLMEALNIPIQLVEGASKNIKLTTADDIKEARQKMAQNNSNIQIPDVRVGHGYDTHQLIDGDHIWLCGVKIPHHQQLKGHSDADVGLHALTDALFASIADGDIGAHFPPSDPQWKGARSDQFLRHAASRVKEARGLITHVDVTLICEEPKIGPHRDAMRQTMAQILSLDVARVSVKATTNELMGFIGRKEGIVALATATVVMT